MGGFGHSHFLMGKPKMEVGPSASTISESEITNPPNSGLFCNIRTHTHKCVHGLTQTPPQEQKLCKGLEYATSNPDFFGKVPRVRVSLLELRHEEMAFCYSVIYLKVIPNSDAPIHWVACLLRIHTHKWETPRGPSCALHTWERGWWSYLTFSLSSGLSKLGPRVQLRSHGKKNLSIAFPDQTSYPHTQSVPSGEFRDHMRDNSCSQDEKQYKRALNCLPFDLLFQGCFWINSFGRSNMSR